MPIPEDQPVADEDSAGEERSTADEETPDVIAHSDDEEQPITGDCTDFKGGCVSW
jgi:hypothetical protein